MFRDLYLYLSICPFVIVKNIDVTGISVYILSADVRFDAVDDDPDYIMWFLFSFGFNFYLDEFIYYNLYYLDI